jgi:PAS domain S-box-containing protein
VSDPLRARLDEVENRLAEMALQLGEANETLDAIRNGEVDAVVVGGAQGQIVYTLENADRPYRVLVEQMKEGAVTLDGQGLLLYANRGFIRLLDRSYEDVIGTPLGRYIADRDAFDAMLAGRGDAAEVTLIAASGRRVPVNLSIAELVAEPGAPPMLCGVVTDLTDNYERNAELAQANARLAEQAAALESNERRLRVLFDSSYSFQGMLSPDGTLLDCNSVSLDAIGASLEDVVGLPFWDTPWFTTTPGVPDRVRAAFDAVHGGETARAELVLALPGGQRIFDFSLRAIRNGAGDITAMVPEAIDLTDIRNAEDALRQAQKLEAIGQLTGGVAHDFNNLLTVIMGSVELLQRPNLPEEKRRRYTDAISQTAERASRLTGQLLAFARRQALKPEQFEVGESLQSVKAIVTSLTGSRIELSTQFPKEPCFVMADRSQFDTAIVNMAINARDAMDGEGRIVISARPVQSYPAVRSHAAVEGDFVAISISDNGTGINPADLERIFEPFFTTKSVGSGTGLGLSQVIGFAKQSQGEILVESRKGQGSTFTLFLPRVEAAPDQIAPAAQESVSGHGLCVLVVEDNADVGSFATQALRELGYDSVLADNADMALAILHGSGEGHFHIVFSDVIMPGMSGLDMGAIIRRDFPHLPVILASGYSHVLAAGGSQGFELVHKPYSIEELSRVISKVMRRVQPATL